MSFEEILMRTLSSRSRSIAAIAASALALALGACSSHSSVPLAPQPALVRAVHGSPDAGPVDIYVYAQGGTRASTPTVAAAAYPQITGYLSVPAGPYTVDVIAPAGSPSTTSPVATENVTVSSQVAYSIVVGGKVANKTLTFANFVEPTETAGQTALIVHHASPFVQNALNGPVGVGVYDASQTAPTSIAQLFGFSLTTPISGPAASGAVSGGQFFLSPLPSGLPTAVGFAAGPPTTGGNFTTLITATPSQLASGLKNPTAAQHTLAADTTSEIPAGAHVSIFAVDTTSAAQLIGTLDP
jgi:hypothetical protein